jgi:hypothetical protein
MNLRHVVAFALVGWYLIVPPTRVDREGFPEALPDKSGFFYDTDAPLSKWFNEGNFDSVAACDQALSELRQSPKATAADRVQEFAAQCIATDDPRLKGD